YAWGQDAWNDLEGTLTQLKPAVKLTASQMPKLGAGQYNADIPSLMAAAPDVLHSSLWGGALEGFIVQAQARGLLARRLTVLPAGETAAHRPNKQLPGATVSGARGPHGAFAPDSDLNTWLRESYQAKFKADPSYPSYKMAQTILGV